MPVASPISPPSPTPRSNVLRSTVIVSSARLLYILLSLSSGVLSARYFGTSVQKDCYVVAQTVPGLMTTLLAGGVYITLLVTLAEIGRREGLRAQRAFTRRMLWHLTLLLGPLAIAAIVLARPIVTLVAPGFPPRSIALSAQLLRIAFPGAAVSIYFTVGRCLFETRSQFVIPRFVNTLIPLVSLGVLVFLFDRLGIFCLVVGPLLGGLVACALLSAFARGMLRDPEGFTPEPPASDGHSEKHRRLWVMLLPMSLASNFGQINLLVDNAFASYLPAGSITMLGFAFVILSNTELLTTISMAEVAFTRLIAAAVRGADELRDTFRSNLNFMVIVAAPLSAGALSLGVPLVRLLFQRGEFSLDATAGVARLLGCYSLEILFTAHLLLFSSVLFARRRLAMVAWCSAGAILANTALDYLLMKPFGVDGIALATTGVALAHLLVLAFAARREVPDLMPPGYRAYATKVLGSAALMGALVFAWKSIYEGYVDVGFEAARLCEVAGGLGLGAGSYVGLLHLLKVPEVREIARRIRRSI